MIIVGMNLERAQDYVTQSFAGENDDNILMCCVCQLPFTSLYNKQSHYSGKLHLQTVIENLDKLVQDDSNVHCPSGSGVVSSLQVVAKDYHSKKIL